MRRIALVLAILLSGCFGGGGGDPLSQEEAEMRAEEAVESFASGFMAGGGEMRRVHGEFNAEDFGDSGFGMGDASVELSLEWGKGDAMKIEMSTASGGFNLDVSMFCDPTRNVIVWGEEVYESRPSEELGCGDIAGEGDEAFQLEDLQEAEELNVTLNDDGTITAIYEDDDGKVTITIDRQGRVSRIDIDAEEGGGFLIVEYGKRRAIDMPEATDRIPLSLFGWGQFYNGAYEWSASGYSMESAPYDEIEIHITDFDAVTYKLPAGQDIEQDGFTVDWTDDGDGVFGSNDTFTITHPQWQETGDYDVVMWDTWADAEVGDVPIPGFAPLWLLGALLVLRRRR